jgi:8-oxo-dGTP pyrophosphatase MutT (NUDIX family)
MLLCLETLCEPGTAFAPNEDAVWHSETAAVVLDGATGFPDDHFTDAPTDASWLVREVIKELDRTDASGAFEARLQRAMDVAAQRLNAAIGRSIEPDREPMAALGAVHVGDASLRYWLIGDVSLLVRAPDGTLTTYLDPRPEESECAILREWTRLASRGVSYDERRKLIRPLIRQARQAVNTPAGYHMFTRHATGLAAAITGSLPASPGMRFCLMSDGFARASLLFGASQQGHFRATGTALRERLSWIRQNEILDPDGCNWPRIKPHDDASALLMEIPLLDIATERFSDHRAPLFPVSVKGIVHYDGTVALLKNERNEWELPGGKLEFDEQPESCVVREIAEELGVDVAVERIIDTWVYDILGQVKVLIVTYLCRPCRQLLSARLSYEHKELGFFRVSQIAEIPLPEGYRRSINAALGDCRSDERALHD